MMAGIDNESVILNDSTDEEKLVVMDDNVKVLLC